MSVGVLENAAEHPARTAAMNSIRNIEAKNRDGWLALFHDDAMLQDPVGESPLDPTGEGHIGKDAIAAFYDNVIGKNDMRFAIRQTFACGSECANVGTITTKTAEGFISRTELVMVYKVDADGRILSLRAFWEFDAMVGELF